MRATRIRVIRRPLADRGYARLVTLEPQTLPGAERLAKASAEEEAAQRPEVATIRSFRTDARPGYTVPHYVLVGANGRELVEYFVRL